MLPLTEYSPALASLPSVSGLFYRLSNCVPDNEQTPDIVRAKRLGCAQSINQNKEDVVLPGGWSGVVRFQPDSNCEPIEFAVLPRKIGNGTVDLVSMYLECMSDPIVAPHMGEPAVFIWHDQPPIECPESFQQDALVLLVLSYLQELHQLCLRHLRNQFVRTTENLSGRVKGRIDISQQVRINLPRGRLDRTVCDFTIHSNNCRENQILKTALERSARLLTRFHQSNLPIWSKIHFCRHELGDVEEVEVSPRLFQGIRYTGLFRPYEKAHNLAKCILNLLPPDPHSKDTKLPTKVPPFAICTYELFERYCEVKLREKFQATTSKLWVGYQDGKPGGEARLRPDFLICSDSSDDRWILDAKNKPKWKDNCTPGNGEWDSDVPQLCRYSRYGPILKELGYGETEQTSAAPKMGILYPGAESDEIGRISREAKESLVGIQNLHAFSVNVPTKNP